MSTVYGLYRTGKEAPSYKIFASEKDAQESGNAFSIVKSQSCLSDSRLFPTGFLVEIYNLNADRKVAKFRDRATAESRVWKMLTDQKDRAITSPVNSVEITTPSTEGKIKSRKSSAFNGCRFKATVDENTHRRKKSAGWPYFQIVLENPGISYDDLKSKYESLGLGRVEPHIRHDLKREKIEVLD